MTRRIDVLTQSRHYPVWIAHGLLNQPEPLQAACRGRHILLLSNTTVAPLLLERVRAHLQDHVVRVHLLEDGEPHKSWAEAGRALEALAQMPASRDATLVALGGGVVGDLGGFVAACYMRGIAFVQIPTTLLAMVDSSVGGKTAVNLPAGKNLAGAFWQPQGVLVDPGVLATLPAREFAAGLAEVVKYGAIRDAAFFAWLHTHAAAILAREPQALVQAIATSIQHKAEVVAADETEQGERALLNFGHTFGHAIEAEQHYRGLLHGEAVAVGMRLAAELSARLGLAPIADTARLEQLLQACGLPVRIPPGLAADALLLRMRGDKKNLSGRIRVILWAGIGQALLPREIEESALLEVLRSG